MISRKRLNVEQLPLWGKALVRIAGKNLSEKELTDLHKNKFRNIFVYSFFATGPWFAKRYLEVLREKIDTKTLLFRMRNRLIRAGAARNKKEADRLIEKKVSGFLERSEHVKKKLFVERAQLPTIENQIANHQARNAFSGIETVCDDILFYLKK